LLDPPPGLDRVPWIRWCDELPLHLQVRHALDPIELAVQPARDGQDQEAVCDPPSERRAVADELLVHVQRVEVAGDPGEGHYVCFRQRATGGGDLEADRQILEVQRSGHGTPRAFGTIAPGAISVYTIVAGMSHRSESTGVSTTSTVSRGPSSSATTPKTYGT